MDYDAIYNEVTTPKGGKKAVDYDSIYSEVTTPKATPKKQGWSVGAPSLDNLTTNLGVIANSGVAKGIRDPLDGAAQLLANVLPDGVSSAINKANNFVADKTGLVAKLPASGMDGFIKENEQAYQAQRGDTGMDWGRLAGNVISPMNLALASKIPQGVGVGQRVLSGIGTGAALGGITPTSGEGSFADEKTKQIATSAAFGGVLPMLTGAVGRVISPKASTNPQVKLLRENGVTPTVGQTLGGAANKFEEKLGSWPIVGDGVAAARGRANEQFNTAVYADTLKPVGISMPKNLDGRDAVRFAESQLSNRYDEVLGKIGAIKTDGQFNSSISSLDKMVDKLMMPKSEKMKFKMSLNDVKQTIDKNGVLTSEGYKMLESALGRDAKTLGISQNAYDARLAPAVKQLQAELKGLLKRQAGSNADELQKVNDSWARFTRVGQAAKSVGAENGNFTPAQFQNAVKSMDKSKWGFAKGNALMQDFGDAGKSVLGSKVPNSGTTDRLLLGGLGAAWFDPTLGLSLLGGSAMYSNPMQKLLTGAIANRPQSAQAISQVVNKGTPYLLPAGLGLLNYIQN